MPWDVDNKREFISRIICLLFARSNFFAISWIPQCWEQLLWIRHVSCQYIKDDS